MLGLHIRLCLRNMVGQHSHDPDLLTVLVIRRHCMPPCFWSSDCGSIIAVCCQRPPGEAWGKVCRPADASNPGNVRYTRLLSTIHLTSLSPSKSRLEMDWLVSTSRMNEHWRGARKLLDRSLGRGLTESYQHMIEDKTRMFLGQLLESPDDFLSHILLSVCSVFASCV